MTTVMRIGSWWLRISIRWRFLLFRLSGRDVGLYRGPWIWVGRLAVGFRRVPRFRWKFMVKRGCRRGIEVVQFGPVVLSFPRTRTEAA